MTAHLRTIITSPSLLAWLVSALVVLHICLLATGIAAPSLTGLASTLVADALPPVLDALGVSEFLPIAQPVVPSLVAAATVATLVVVVIFWCVDAWVLGEFRQRESMTRHSVAVLCVLALTGIGWTSALLLLVCAIAPVPLAWFRYGSLFDVLGLFAFRIATFLSYAVLVVLLPVGWLLRAR